VQSGQIFDLFYYFIYFILIYFILTLKYPKDAIDGQIEIVASSERADIICGGVEQLWVSCPVVQPEVGPHTKGLENAETQKRTGHC
jgi:hypothetical protein